MFQFFYSVLGCVLLCFGRLNSVSCLRLYMFVLLFSFFHCSHRFKLLSEIFVVLGRLGCSKHVFIDLSCYGCFRLY